MRVLCNVEVHFVTTSTSTRVPCSVEVHCRQDETFGRYVWSRGGTGIPLIQRIGVLDPTDRFGRLPERIGDVSTTLALINEPPPGGQVNVRAAPRTLLHGSFLAPRLLPCGESG